MTDAPLRKPNQIEMLVAYLDGELNNEQAGVIETQLRKDPKLRQMAEDLDRTWGMLDALEPVAASETFSRQTMQTVVTTGLETGQQRPASFRKILSSIVCSQALTWFGIGVIGTLCGLSAEALRSTPEESIEAAQLLRQIHVLQRYPEYSIIPDVGLLPQLSFPNSEVPSPRKGQ